LPALTNFRAKGWSEKARLPPRAAMKRGLPLPAQDCLFEVDFRNYKYISIEFPVLYADLYATKRGLVPDTKWHQGLSITPKFSQSHHKGKLVLGSIVELRRARGFVSRNLLGGLKRSLVFKVDRYPVARNGWQETGADNTGIKCPASKLFFRKV
jgi:hypothetical protein